MSRRYLLPSGGNFYKANLHCHSTNSDGSYTVEKLKEIYTSRGYSIVAFSDHNKLIPHIGLKDSAFLPLTAIEIDCTRHDPDWMYAPTYHVNYFSSDEKRDKFIDIKREYSVDNINDIIRRANAEGFLAQYNHPRWSFQQGSDFTPLEGLWAFEVYNTGCQIEMVNGYAEYEYDLMCRSGKLLCTTATDDNHNGWKDETSPYNDSFGGFTMIKAPSLSYGDIIDALSARNCYASTGPEITELWEEDGILHVACSPCSVIMAATGSRATRIYRSNSDDLTGYDIDIKELPVYGYLRVECIDRFGNKAMTRAYAPSEVGK